ncbi:hypothetical protein ACTMQE_08090 [Escherichia coli]
MKQDARLLSAMQKMCDQKCHLILLRENGKIANIPYMLQEKRYQELDEIYNQVFTGEFGFFVRLKSAIFYPGPKCATIFMI